MVRIDQPIPTVFRRGKMGYFATDLRKWGGGRPTMRNPEDSGWPKRGEHTEFEDQAVKWAIRYRDALLKKKYRRLEGEPEDQGPLWEAIRRFERHRERTAEAWTRAGDSTALGHLEDLVGKDRPVLDIQPEELQRWFNERLDQGYKRSTLGQYRNSLSAFFRWLGGPNPARALVLPKQEGRDVRPWTDVELRKLRKAADTLGEEYRRFFELAVGTGGRYAELLALEAGDFDQRNKTVRFKRQAVLEGRRPPKGLKGDQNRTALVLSEWWPWHLPKREGPIVTLRRPMGVILEKAGMKEPEILNHAARHTYARICRERYHIPIAILRTYLGHSSERVTEESYGWMGTEVAIEYGRRAVYGKG